MLDQSKRFGRFTSSNIYKLLTVGKDKTQFGVPAKTYILEKQMELEFGRSIEKTTSSREMEWGKLCESRVFNILPLTYVDMHDTTIQHPIYKSWAGSPDHIKETEIKKVAETKCPFTHKSFYNLVVAFNKGGIEEVRKVHDSGEQYYQQCISNAILTGRNKAELIVYMPYQSELADIRLEANNFGFTWVTYTADSDLPYLIDGGKFKNVNILEFDIPQSDIDLMEDAVKRAESILYPNGYLATHDNETNATIIEKI